MNTAPLFIINGTSPNAGNPGTAIIPVGAGSDYSYSNALQPDGRIIVAGVSYVLSGGNNIANFSLIRLNIDGSLDTSFNRTGTAIIPPGGIGGATGVTIQPDGKIVIVGGTTYGYGTYSACIIRLNADGSLDASFNDSGKITVPVGYNSFDAPTVVAQADGKLVIAGTTISPSSGYDCFGLIRLNTDGSLDTTFSDGIKFIARTHWDSNASIAVQSDNKIVLAGTNNGFIEGFEVIRLNSNGSLDTSFNGSGVANIPIGGFDGRGQSVTLQPDGKIIVAGYSSDIAYNVDFNVVRLNSDGSLDQSFNGSGKVNIPVGSGNDYGYSVIVQPDGKIVVAGTSSDNTGDNDFSLIRLNTDGSLDSSFNHTGKVIASLGSRNDYGNSAHIQLDGKIIVSGGTITNTGNVDFALLRLNVDGSIDTAFNPATESLSGSVTYIENNNAIALDNSVSIFDSELSALNNGAGNYEGASVTLERSGGADSNDKFFAIDSLIFSSDEVLLDGRKVGTVSSGEGTLTIIFNNNATQAVADKVLSSLGYLNDSDAPPISIRIDWTFTDGNTAGKQGIGGALTTSGSTTVNIIAVNDEPVGDVIILGAPTQGEMLIARNTLADADGLGSISYRWQADEVDIDGAISNSFALTQNQVGKTVRVIAQYIDSFGTSEAISSVATASVTNTNDTPTGTITIEGQTAQGQTVTATNTLEDVDGLGAISYQWRAGGIDIPGKTESTLTLSQSEVGLSISVVAHYTDAYGTAESVASSNTALISNADDEATGTLVVSGLAAEGGSLSTTLSDVSDADGATSVTYRWQYKISDAWHDIADQTSAVLFIPDDQSYVGKTIRVIATTNDALAGTTEFTSSEHTVGNLNDPPTGSFLIDGNPIQGQTLIATNSLTDPDGLGAITYQWIADGSIIEGETNSQLFLSQSEVGKQISLEASYTDGWGTVEKITTATITGTNTTINFDNLEGMTFISRTPVTESSKLSDQLLSTYGVRFSSAAGYAAVVNLGAGHATSGGNGLGGVTIDGKLTYSALNPISITFFDPKDCQTKATTNFVSIKVDNAGSNLPVSLVGYNAENYIIASVTTLDVGGATLSLSAAGLHRVDFIGTADDGGAAIDDLVFNTLTTSSTGLAPIANINDTPTGTVTILGLTTQGQTLTAINTLKDVDGIGAISYQWRADGVDIPGKTENTLTLSQSEVGQSISAVARYTDAYGAAESVVSSNTALISNIDDEATGTLIVSGPAEEGGSLSATLSAVSDADGTTSITYRWQHKISDAWHDIPAQTSAALSIPDDQSYVGKIIRVIATTTDALAGTTEFPSNEQTVCNSNDPPTGSIFIEGNPVQGQTLTARSTLSDLDGMPTNGTGVISYQWKSNATDIPGATNYNYLLTENEVSTTITVVASYIDNQGTAESVSSSSTAPVENVNDAPMGLALSVRTIVENITVSTGIKVGDIAVNDPDAAGNSNVLAVEGTDGAVFTVRYGTALYFIGTTPDYETKPIYSITLTSTDANNGSALIYSEDVTISVINANDLYTGTLLVSGNAVVGQTLTIADTVADVDGISESSLQWLAGGVAISGATGNSYTLKLTELGKAVSVQKTYLDPFGSFIVSSTPTAAIVDSVTKILMVRTNYTGNNAAEWVVGTSSNNTITTLGGNDTLDGAVGVDKLVGGTGDDFYIVDLTSAGGLQDTVTEDLGAGADSIQLRGTATNTKASTISAPANVENLDATATASTLLNLVGNALNNAIIGNASANVINGGTGADQLSGGAGRDTFVFATGSSGQTTGYDQILDYVKGLVGTGDLIDFSASLTVGGSTAAATNTQAAIDPKGIATFATGSGQTIADALTDITTRFTVARDSLGEFALFRISDAGSHFLFISDGAAGVTPGDTVIELVGVTSINTIDITGGNLTIMS